MKILIADEDARMRKMVKQTVAGLATEYCEAADGAEAIAHCGAQRPDWVLMDFRMRPMDGLRATAEIKARFPQTHVVTVSQYDAAELRAEAARVLPGCAVGFNRPLIGCLPSATGLDARGLSLPRCH
jgi:CheY-like chemotaxis protein